MFECLVFLELVRMKRVFRLLQFVVHYFHTLFNPVNKWEYSCVDFWIVCLALQMKIEFLILKEYRMIPLPKKFNYRYAEWYDSHQFFLLWISHVDQWPTYLEMRTVVNTQVFVIWRTKFYLQIPHLKRRYGPYLCTYWFHESLRNTGTFRSRVHNKDCGPSCEFSWISIYLWPSVEWSLRRQSRSNSNHFCV